jgi:hypothetical protein
MERLLDPLVAGPMCVGYGLLRERQRQRNVNPTTNCDQAVDDAPLIAVVLVGHDFPDRAQLLGGVEFLAEIVEEAEGRR